MLWKWNFFFSSPAHCSIKFFCKHFLMSLSLFFFAEQRAFPNRVRCNCSFHNTQRVICEFFFCNSYKTALSRVRYAYTSWSNNEYRESITCNMELQIITLCKKGVVIIFFRPGTLDIFRSTHSCISRMQNCTNCTKNRIYKLMAKNSENAFNSRGYFQREAGWFYRETFSFRRWM